jgi:prephenate dehydrogenase
MTVKIAIIGLGQIGASIGLALANHKDQVTTIGYDTEGEVNRKAMKKGAVEKIGHGLYATVAGADVIILALPLDQVRETLRAMAQDVREEAVVIDTATAKLAVAAWVEEFLPPKRHYVGLILSPNPLLMDETGSGVDSARADLFHNGLAAITTPHGTAGEAIKLAASFVTLLGARPYFSDPAEVDGIMASVDTLPALAAAALAETVMGQPGWNDIRKLAGHHFMAGMRSLDGEQAVSLAETARSNRVNTVRVLDEYISALQSLRDEVDRAENSNLPARLKGALNECAQWQRTRANNDWQSGGFPRPEMPTFNDIWKGQLGLGKLLDRRNKKTRDD